MALMAQFNHKQWVKLLPLVMYNLNTSRSSSTKYMPYEVTFNQKPNTGSKKTFVELNDKDLETPVCAGNQRIETRPLELTLIHETDEKSEEEADKDSEEEIDEEAKECVVFKESMVRKQAEADAMRQKLNVNKLKNAEKLIKNTTTNAIKSHGRSNLETVSALKYLEKIVVVSTLLPEVVVKVTEYKEIFYTIVTVFGALKDN